MKNNVTGWIWIRDNMVFMRLFIKNLTGKQLVKGIFCLENTII